MKRIKLTHETEDIIKVLFSVLLFVALRFAEIPRGWMIALYLVAYLVSGYETILEALEKIRDKELFSEDFLMTVATIGAFAIGEYEESVAVMVFFTIGELFEDIAVGKSRDSIRSLMDIRPDKAVLIDVPVLAGNSTLAGDNVLAGNSTLAGDNVLAGNSTLAGGNVLAADNVLAGDSTLPGNNALTDDNALKGRSESTEAAPTERTVEPSLVEVGSLILVRPGERIPLDGIVEEGEGLIDMSALTGESMPESVGAGDKVLSGCISLTGVLKIRTTKEYGESTASKILELVENAAQRKSGSEKFITKFARYYTPIVCCSALALAVLPPIIRVVAFGADGNWKTWLYYALSFLVTSCPCALVISIPLTFFAGLGMAGRCGILIKGSNYLEALSKVDTVVFDKTGTLTKGSFEVTGIHHNSREEKEILEIAGLVESRSTHPVAKSIVRAAEVVLVAKTVETKTVESEAVVAEAVVAETVESEAVETETVETKAVETETVETKAGETVTVEAGMGTRLNDRFDMVAASHVSEVVEHAGKGITAVLDTRGLCFVHETGKVKVAVGNALLMDELGIQYEQCSEAGTVVHVAVDNAYEGHILISDTERAGAKEAVSQLKKLGVEKTVMLTGDREKVAEAVAEKLGIDEVYAGLLPSDKLKKLYGIMGEDTLKDHSGKPSTTAEPSTGTSTADEPLRKPSTAAEPLRKSAHLVAFVGDGINDAPVITGADVGIAMGALGSDAAIAAADVVLMDDDPLKLPTAVRISRKAMKLVNENIVLSIGIKSACLILIPLGVVGMEVAVFADVGVMVLAVVNSLRILVRRGEAESKKQ